MKLAFFGIYFAVNKPHDQVSFMFHTVCQLLWWQCCSLVVLKQKHISELGCSPGRHVASLWCHSSSFRVNKCGVLLLLICVPHAYESTAENIPQLMHHLIFFVLFIRFQLQWDRWAECRLIYKTCALWFFLSELSNVVPSSSRTILYI